MFCIKFGYNPSTRCGVIAVTTFTRDLDLTLTLGPYDLHYANIASYSIMYSNLILVV